MTRALIPITEEGVLYLGLIPGDLSSTDPRDITACWPPEVTLITPPASVRSIIHTVSSRGEPTRQITTLCNTASLIDCHHREA